VYVVNGSVISASKALYNPLLLAERTPVVLFDPQLHATVMEGVVALTPYHYTFLLLALSLAAQAGIHDLYPTDGTRVTLHVPLPHSYGIPLLEGEGRAGRRLRSLRLSLPLSLCFSVCHFALIP